MKTFIVIKHDRFGNGQTVVAALSAENTEAATRKANRYFGVGKDEFIEITVVELPKITKTVQLWNSFLS